MVRCDRSDHDHKSLEAARLCAALDALDNEDPHFYPEETPEDGKDWAFRRVRGILADIDKASR